MKNSTILLNSCSTDLSELRKDVDSGLYEQNTEGFLKEIDRITRKLNYAKEEKCLEDGMGQMGTEERMAKEAEDELTDMFGEGGKEEVKEYYRVKEESGRHVAF